MVQRTITNGIAYYSMQKLPRVAFFLFRLLRLLYYFALLHIDLQWLITYAIFERLHVSKKTFAEREV